MKTVKTQAKKTTAKKTTAKARATRSSSVETIDDYLATLPPESRSRLSELRRLIHKAVAGLDEGLTYKIPVFRLGDRRLVSMGAAKNHYALYVIGNDAVLQKHRADLEGYEIGKGVVKFPLDAPLPAALVTKLVRAAVATK
jgi:uncharacterized protein YdhG (YjbR/CyaY superfamily)